MLLLFVFFAVRSMQIPQQGSVVFHVPCTMHVAVSTGAGHKKCCVHLYALYCTL